MTDDAAPARPAPRHANGVDERFGDLHLTRKPGEVGGSEPSRGRASLEDRAAALATITAEVVECRLCPRLVAWREEAARLKVARYATEEYWARPVPGFGDPAARVLIVGLAPAAHGGNRTGRVFTGDRSGDFLWTALHATGFANQPVGRRRDDGLRLTDAYVAAVVRCAPPLNRPTVEERDTCLPYLEREMRALADVRVIVALGGFGWDGALRALAAHGLEARPRPRFGHGAEARVGPYSLLGTYHPSQQNTFTGRLTMPMFEAIFSRARELAELGEPIRHRIEIARVAHDDARRLAPSLVDLAVRSKASWGYDEALLAAFRRSMEESTVASAERSGSDVAILVARDAGTDPGTLAGTVVGFALVADEGDRSWLDDLWVEPGRFGQGIGRALWSAAVEAAEEMGRSVLAFEADPNAVPFYERMGARTFGERPSTLAAGRMLPLMRVELAGRTREGR